MHIFAQNTMGNSNMWPMYNAVPKVQWAMYIFAKCTMDNVHLCPMTSSDLETNFGPMKSGQSNKKLSLKSSFYLSYGIGLVFRGDTLLLTGARFRTFNWKFFNPISFFSDIFGDPTARTLQWAMDILGPMYNWKLSSLPNVQW